VLAPLRKPEEPHDGTAPTSVLQRTVKIAAFLFQYIYGRSHVPPLSALLQRQFRPMSPLPLRRDSLLITQPDWFESRVNELTRTLQQRAADIAEQAAAAAALGF